MIPFLLYDGLGLDDMGICGTLMKTPGLKISFNIHMLVMVSGYGISVFGGSKAMKKIRSHNVSVTSDFQVSSCDIEIYLSAS